MASMRDKRPKAISEHESRDKAQTEQEGDYQHVLWHGLVTLLMRVGIAVGAAALGGPETKYKFWIFWFLNLNRKFNI